MSKNIFQGLGQPDLKAMITPRIPEIRPPELPLHHTNPAEWTYRCLAENIKEFQDGLDDEHEVGLTLVSFGASTTFHMTGMGYFGPFNIMFYGVNADGDRVELNQHYTQLSVLLVAMKKTEEKPRRIGFKLNNDDD